MADTTKPRTRSGRFDPHHITSAPDSTTARFTIESLLVKMAEALKLTSSPRWRFNRRRQTMLSAAFIAAIAIIAGPTGGSPPKNRRSTSTTSITAKPIKSQPDSLAARTLIAGERPTA